MSSQLPEFDVAPRMYGVRVHALIESISALIVEYPSVEAAE